MNEFEQGPEQHLAIDSIFVVVSPKDQGFLCLQSDEKNYFLVFSSRQLAEDYWNTTKSFSEAQVVEIPAQVMGTFVQDLLELGPIALDAVRADGELKQFKEISSASVMHLPHNMAQA